MKGRNEVERYLANYARLRDWRFAPGLIDRRPAMLVHDSERPSKTLAYFVLVTWADDSIVEIRDFHYARYAIDGAELLAMG
jgi:RNA polymerase sigma-70 factor (ECF subfamily)